MKILRCILVLAALLSLAVAADMDVSGKWSGSFNATGANGEIKETTAVMLLKQSGTDITGSVGPSDDAQFAIQKGKIEGDKITLEADHEGHTIRFDLVLAYGRISGDVSMSVEGQTAKAKIDVTRAK